MFWYFITASYAAPSDPIAGQTKFSTNAFYTDDLTAMALAQGFFLAAKNKDPQIASVLVSIFSDGRSPVETKGWMSRENYIATVRRDNEWKERQKRPSPTWWSI